MKKISIHQPENIPWAGFFNKMSQVDEYVILDHVQFRKNYFQNRNKIVDPSGRPIWLTVPVEDSGLNTTIKDKKISSNESWKSAYLSKIEYCYGRHRYFDEYFPVVKSVVNSSNNYLMDYNMRMIHFAREVLGLSAKITFSSSLNVMSSKSALILEICEKMHATEYLSGPSGRDYLNEADFIQSGIFVRYHEFSPRQYEAINYVPGLSFLDILFNCGRDMRDFVL